MSDHKVSIDNFFNFNSKLKIFLYFIVFNQTASITGNQGSFLDDNCTDCFSWNFALNGMIMDQRPFVSGQSSKAWISFTLPETILITKIKAFTNEVNGAKNKLQISKYNFKKFVISHFLFQTLAYTYFSNIDVRVGTTKIPNTTNQIGLNKRCSYLPLGANNSFEVLFECGSQGILGNTISLQNRNFNLSLLEVEFLGNFE